MVTEKTPHVVIALFSCSRASPFLDRFSVAHLSAPHNNLQAAQKNVSCTESMCCMCVSTCIASMKVQPTPPDVSMLLILVPYFRRCRFLSCRHSYPRRLGLLSQRFCLGRFCRLAFLLIPMNKKLQSNTNVQKGNGRARLIVGL